jgi:fumarylacetoacetate (FAA) hydrolase
MLFPHDGTRAVAAGAIVPSLIHAMQRWDAVAPSLQTLSDELNAGTAASTLALDPTACAAPLPRAPQWLDASAFLNHGRLINPGLRAPCSADQRLEPGRDGAA